MYSTNIIWCGWGRRIAQRRPTRTEQEEESPRRLPASLAKPLPGTRMRTVSWTASSVRRRTANRSATATKRGVPEGRAKPFQRGKAREPSDAHMPSPDERSAFPPGATRAGNGAVLRVARQFSGFADGRLPVADGVARGTVGTSKRCPIAARDGIRTNAEVLRGCEGVCAGSCERSCVRVHDDPRRAALRQSSSRRWAAPSVTGAEADASSVTASAVRHFGGGVPWSRAPRPPPKLISVNPAFVTASTVVATSP